MNEQIRQLAEQALQLVADEHTGGDESRLNTDSYHVKDLIQVKFAELLVKKCMEQVWYSREDGINGNISQVIKDRIKEQFGVEE
jgi:hypothetical protein